MFQKAGWEIITAPLPVTAPPGNTLRPVRTNRWSKPDRGTT